MAVAAGAAAAAIAVAKVSAKVIIFLVGMGVGYLFFRELTNDLKEVKDLLGRVSAETNQRLDAIEKKLDVQDEKIKKIQGELEDLKKRSQTDAVKYQHFTSEFAIQNAALRAQLDGNREILKRLESELAALLKLDEKTLGDRKKEVGKKLEVVREDIVRVKNTIENVEKGIDNLPKTIEKNIPEKPAAPPKIYVNISKKGIEVFKDKVLSRTIPRSRLKSVLSIEKVPVQAIIIFPDVSGDEDLVSDVKSLAEEYKVPCEILQ